MLQQRIGLPTRQTIIRVPDVDFTKYIYDGRTRPTSSIMPRGHSRFSPPPSSGSPRSPSIESGNGSESNSDSESSSAGGDSKLKKEKEDKQKLRDSIKGEGIYSSEIPKVRPPLNTWLLLFKQILILFVLLIARRCGTRSYF